MLSHPAASIRMPVVAAGSISAENSYPSVDHRDMSNNGIPAM
jgi:hypothetical protein